MKRVSIDDIVDFLVLSGIFIFLFSLLIGMLFLLKDGSAPAAILYPIVIGLLLVGTGIIIKVANE